MEIKRDDTEDLSTGIGRGIDATSTSRRSIKRTPAQLAKKRAADREAQRVTRERTKNRIESLEKLVQTLSNVQHSLDCTSALRERDEARAETVEVRSKLGSVIQQLQALSVPATTSPPNISLNSEVASPRQGLYVPSPAYHLVDAKPHSVRSPSSGLPYSADTPKSGTSTIASTPQAWANPKSPAATTPSHRYTYPLNSGHLLQTRERQYIEVNAPPPPLVSTTGRRWSIIDRQYPQAPEREWEVPIINTPATCPLDGILLNFISARRNMLQQGATEREAVGPCYPNFSGLLGIPIDPAKDPISQVIIDVINKVETVEGLPRRVAVLLLMFLMLKWQIHPTLENWNRIPTWLRPTPSQRTTPHPAWIDHVHWPGMREILTVDHRAYFQDDILLPWTQTLCLNWSYDAEKVLIYPPHAHEPHINPVFEQHVRRLPNWTLGPRFSQEFPGLVGTYRMAVPEDTGKEAGWEYSGA